MQGIRARVNYGFKDKYLAELSLTYTGSEKFAKNHRWGLFPAMGVGYIVSNESSWAPLKNIFPMFKLKYSLGQVGNDLIASPQDRFFFLSDINPNSWGYAWGRNFNTNYGGFDISRYANPEITWEIAVKQNVGFELDLFRNRAVKVILNISPKIENKFIKQELIFRDHGLTSNVYGNVGKVRVGMGWIYRS